MLFKVPGATSSPGCPGTVTVPGFAGCRYCRWLPRVRSSFHPSFSSILITSRIFGGISPCSVPQRLPGLQRVLNTLLRLALAAERLEAFTLQIQDVLLRDHDSGRDGATAKHFGDFVADLHFMVADVLTLTH